MKTTLHMSVSMDGFIAKADGNSDWVSKIDCDLFEQRYKEIGCVVVGRKTFDQFQGSLYPINDIANIVLTSNKDITSKNRNVSFVGSVKEAVDLAVKKGFERLLIAGGGRTNTAFLEANAIDEIFLSVHPILLSEGIRLFEGSKKEHDFNLVGTREMGDGLVELHYRK